MLRKTAAVILAATLFSAGVPAYSAQAARTAAVQQAVGEWDGVSALEAGKSYVVSASIVIKNAVKIPAGTTVTVESGGKLMIASCGALGVKGRLAIKRGGMLSVNGALKLYSGGSITAGGKLKLGSTSRVTLRGALTAKKTSDISGEPKSLKIDDSAEISLNGALSSEALSLAVYYEARDSGIIKKELSDCLTLLLAEQDGCGALRKYLPPQAFEYIETTLGETALFKACGSWRSELLSELPAGTDLNSVTEINLGSMEIELCDSSYIWGFVNASDIGATIGTALAYSNGKYGRGDLLAVYSGSCTVVTGTGEEYVIYLRGSFVKADGAWYILT